MVRTQISLTEEQVERLKRVAGERGVSMAAVIRDAVDAAVPASDLEDRLARALAAAGSFSSGRSDIGRNHDRELAEIYGE